MPLYFGNTKIDKFTVKIEGGAASLEGNLTVITPPTKLVYDVGDSFDPRGMKVVATIGGLEVPVGSYTVSPDPLVAGTTEVVLTYELDGKTATGSQEITVNSWKSVLQQNTWEQIADCAAKGKAQEWWSVGDTKTAAVNGENLVMTIMGFNHYSLSTSDTKYNDTTYNNGTNKAGITFMATTIPKNDRTLFSSNSNDQYHYGGSDIKTYLDGTLINKFPFASTLMREVKISYYGSNYVIQSIDRQSDYRAFSSNHKLFVPGYNEIGGTEINIGNQTKFAYTAANNKLNFERSDGSSANLSINLRDVNYSSTTGYPWKHYIYDNSAQELREYIKQNAGVSGYYTFVFNF